MLTPQSFPAAQPRPYLRIESRVRRLRRLALASLCGGVLALGAVALEPSAHAGQISADTTAAPDSEAVRTASLLARDVGGTEYFSPSVVAGLGYSPALEGRIASKADGDCSSPIPLPESFEPACRTHDLGYDLLRLAHRHGDPLPEGLRRELDAQFSRAIHASCDEHGEREPGGHRFSLRARADNAGCHAMASIAYKAVQINTMRQGNGAPVEESLPW